jgi:aminopeptidase-like protein
VSLSTISGLDPQTLGSELHAFIASAYPICRSITGDGFRDTLQLIRRQADLTVHEVPSGTPVLDWVVPPEWNIRDAYIADVTGRRVVDFRASNLHVVGYSRPVTGRFPLADLRPHLHSIPSQPERIPYRTSYYDDSWGFCLTQRQLDTMTDAAYDVCIDSTLAPGHLTYGECFIKGELDDEVLLSCHSCHPSLCNDNLSGMAIAARLARELMGLRLRYSYRILFIPGTIGSITWLARNSDAIARIRHGLVLTCLGDAGSMTYKRSRRGHADIDRAVAIALRDSGAPHELRDFIPWGYDERQYCSPGFDLPVGCLMRTPNGEYPEYHTSADNLELVRPAALADSFLRLVGVLDVLEGDRTWLNLFPKGEPQLGRRGLYDAQGGQPTAPADRLAMLWVLNLSDGEHSLLDIAERSRMPFIALERAAALLTQHGLLRQL